MWNKIRLLSALLSAGISLIVFVNTSGCEDGDITIGAYPYWY